MSRLLVVDDDPDICALVAVRLELDGHAVEVEHDGEGGLAAAREQVPDAVLLDWMMPRLTGLEVCLAIRDDPDLTHLPVALLTARSQRVDVQRAFAAGADDYIIKPFSPRELSSRVAALLARGAT